jgi:polar amino acid transport system permease protein
MDLSYLASVSPQLLQGLVVTLEATAVGMAIAALAGLAIAVARLLRIPVLSPMLGFYLLFTRNTPLLVQLYFLYYVLPWYGIRFDAFTVGVIGLGLQFSCYTAEVYRAGFESVHRGQWEAARALNFSTGQTLSLIILPQALKPTVPALGNYLISMFKDSSFLATITVYELLGTTRQLATLSFHYTTLFTALGVSYIVLSYAASLAIRRVELRFSRL